MPTLRSILRRNYLSGVVLHSKIVDGNSGLHIKVVVLM